MFLFATLDGTISASNPGANLYAANALAGTVDVFDSQFHAVKLKGNFVDPSMPAGYAPFGIAAIDGNLFVTYAPQNPGAGQGFVDVFSTEGHFVKRFASHGPLDLPWGVARAPFDFFV